MNTIALNVIGNTLTMPTPTVLTGGSEHVDRCTFVFDPEWSEYFKLAVFSAEDGEEQTAMIIENQCEIPLECLAKSGTLYIGVVGFSGDRILSTNFVTHKIVRGANESGVANLFTSTVSETNTNIAYDAAETEFTLDGDASFSFDAEEQNEAVTFDTLCAQYPSYARKIETDAGNTVVYDFSQASYTRTVVCRTASPFTAAAMCRLMQTLCENNADNACARLLFYTTRILVITAGDADLVAATLPRDKIVFVLDADSENTAAFGKKILVTPTADEAMLMQETGRFDCGRDANDLYRQTVILSNTEENFASLMSDTYGVNACKLIWSEQENGAAAWIDYTLSLLYAAVRKQLLPFEEQIAPFVKQIFWRSTQPDDTFALNASLQPMWISLFRMALNSGYALTLSGYVLVQSAGGGTVTLRPVLYQENADKDARFADSAFDVQTDVGSGITVIPLESVIYGNYTCCQTQPDTYPSKIGAVIAASVADGDAEIIGFSYTLQGIPAAGESVEMLVPQGNAADYTGEAEAPLFLVKTFESGGNDDE